MLVISLFPCYEYPRFFCFSPTPPHETRLCEGPDACGQRLRQLHDWRAWNNPPHVGRLGRWEVSIDQSRCISPEMNSVNEIQTMPSGNHIPMCQMIRPDTRPPWDGPFPPCFLDPGSIELCSPLSLSWFASWLFQPCPALKRPNGGTCSPSPCPARSEEVVKCIPRMEKLCAEMQLVQQIERDPGVLMQDM